MYDEITIFEKFFRAQLLTVGGIVAAVGPRVFNSSAPPRQPFPFLIFTVIPLDDAKGQARSSIQTRLLCDVKIVSSLPLPASVGAAVGALKERFRTAQTFSFESHRISVWHRRPISFSEPGASVDERLINRGGTFQATISRAGSNI